jgi:glutaconate CoA-transferase subunit A
MNKPCSIEEVIALIPNGSKVGIGGCLFTRLPMALVRTLSAANKSNLHLVSWGGGIPLELLLDANAISELSFCFSSLDIFGLSPKFRACLENDSIVVNEYTALALISALEAAAKNLPNQIFKMPTCNLFSKITPIVARPNEYGQASVEALSIDYLLLHAQEADRDGNILIRGARGTDASLIGAARNVLVTVDLIVDEFVFTNNCYVIPSQQVAAFAHVPMGAYPTSSLPNYISDYRAILDYVENDFNSFFLELNSKRASFVCSAPSIGVEQIREAIAMNGTPTSQELSPEDLMICYLASLYRGQDILSAGAVSPLAQGSYFLGKNLNPDLIVLTTGGGYVDVNERPLLLGFGEWLDFESAVEHAGGDEIYHRMYEPGLIDYEVVNCAQVDQMGQTNNLWVTSPSGKKIRLPGQGGMADVADMHANFVIYQMNQDQLSFVSEVSMVSARRTLFTDKDRANVGLRPGKVLYISNLGVYEYEITENKLVKIFSLDEQIPGSSESNLALLRTRIDPLGIRFLESVKGAERLAKIREIISAEEEILNICLGEKDAK